MKQVASQAMGVLVRCSGPICKETRCPQCGSTWGYRTSDAPATNPLIIAAYNIPVRQHIQCGMCGRELS
jgi:hypothetical protein